MVRQVLVASLIALHAAVVLCGPCLHELPGLSHSPDFGSTAQQQHPLKSSHDSADNCPLCHFLAQGHVPVSSSEALPAPHAGDWMRPIPSSVTLTPAARETRQRAPPSLWL